MCKILVCTASHTEVYFQLIFYKPHPSYICPLGTVYSQCSDNTSRTVLVTVKYVLNPYLSSVLLRTEDHLVTGIPL
uniref:Uncharacterized protein n=1 Tax=Pararge aegeria TaxID=116150 RepID=S4PUX9_9NEOP